MNVDLIYRIFVLILYIGLTTNRILFYRKEAMIENITVIKKDLLDQILSKIFGILWLTVLLVYVINSKLFSLFNINLPSYLRIVGLIPGLIALILHFFSHKALGKNFSPNIIIKKEQLLVTNGPYRYIRHPIYLSFFLFSIAFLLISSNWLVGMAWFLGMTILSFLRIPREEKMLEEEFGKKFIEYKNITGAFLPTHLLCKRK